MKHWHYSAKVYERGSMALINISSGIITTPNNMGANETMGYLSKMVSDQQERKDVEISFDAFSLVEADDTEPTAPLTDEDIAQHRHDDKVDAQSFSAHGLKGLTSEQVKQRLNEIHSSLDPLVGGGVIHDGFAGLAPGDNPVAGKSDCICWQCGKPQNSAALAANDFECLNCHIQVADDLTPCINCGKVITRPCGTHYCNRKDADSTNS